MQVGEQMRWKKNQDLRIGEGDFPKYLPKLNSLYEDLFSGGKGFRAKLIQMIAGHLQVEPESVRLLAQTIEFIHNASLLHDDLIDRAALRRSKPAAWVKYSPEYAVLAGDYLLARVMVHLSRHGNLALIQYTAEMISDLLEGEWIQDSLVQDWGVRLQELDRVHNLKTASLFKWCLRAPFIYIHNSDESLHSTLEEMGGLLGMLFQRSDDLLDFDVRNYEKKALLGDLKSGYLNSFAAFLVDGLGANERNRFKESQDLEQVYAALGKDKFEQKLREFDEVNQSLIDLYDHYCERLGSESLKSYPNLVTDLKSLAKPLYWRKVRS